MSVDQRNDQVTTNQLQQPNAMGGAPSQTMNVNGTIPPNQPTAPASPDTTQMPLNTRQAPATPAVPTLAPQQDPNKPHWLSSALDGVLKAATGGPVMVTNPDGTRSVAQQSRSTLGKTLIAATLAGLLAKDENRQTPYGPVRDYSGTGANAIAAGEGVVDAMRHKP